MQKSLRSAVLLGSVLLAVACGVVPALAQSGVHTPKPGSAERKAIMDALRVPVQHDLKMPVIFVVRHPEPEGYLRVKQGWAFVDAEFRHPNGDPMGPSYYGDAEGGLSADACGLLHRVNGRWRVLVHNVGATDVEWTDWERKYHAPAGLVPNQENHR